MCKVVTNSLDPTKRITSKGFDPKKKKLLKDTARPAMLPIKVQIDQSATNGLRVKVLKHLGII